MHCYSFNSLPITFAETWSTNRARNPARNLRNADDLYIPAHKMATLKRLPLFTFPRVWNEEHQNKHNPIQHLYLKQLKSALILSIVV